MTPPGIDDPLTESELNIIEQTALEYRSGLNIKNIKSIIRGGSKNLQNLRSTEITSMSDEERLAYQILAFRESSYDEDFLRLSEFLLTEETIKTGAESIREHDDYFRFEPCVELIFELDREEVKKMYEYIIEFEKSDYSTTSEQYRHEIKRHNKNTFSIEDDGELIAELLKFYKNICGLFEITFPNLLALKRIVDGETPSNNVLQKKSFSSVRRELIDTDNEPNSVYFDLIVNQYDSNLRNGLSHGDVINDTVNSEVRIPSNEICYTYTEIDRLMTHNFSSALFLSGFYRALIEWRFKAYKNDIVNRERLGI